MRINGARTFGRRESLGSDGQIVTTRQVLLEIDRCQNGDTDATASRFLRRRGFYSGGVGAPGYRLPGMVINGIQIDQEGRGDQKKFRAQISYTSDPPEIKDDNPLNDELDPRWSDESVAVVRRVDRFGNAVLNKVGLPYTSLPAIELPIKVLTVIRNEATDRNARSTAYTHRLNSTTFLGGPPGTVLCREVSGNRQRRNDFRFWPTTYVFAFLVLGHDPELVEQDIYELGDDGNRVAILDGQGKPINAPVPLDANGKAVPVDQLPDGGATTKVELVERADFNDFGLRV
ncbi:MAG: hypothetical protein AAF532_02160 [Planctomycetota bacterium]